MKDVDISETLPDKVLVALRSAIGSSRAMLHEPSFMGNELVYLKECIDSTFVSSVGKFVDRFEAELAKFTGARYAVSVVSGTAALQIALKLAGVQQGDEVLVPALTFVATANAVTYCNATPHFVDSEELTLGVDAGKLREYLDSRTEQRNGKCVNIATDRVIRALLPMHTFGHPADIDGLLAISRDFNIVIVEDAAESLGSYYRGKHTGTFGLLGTLSFNGNKTITTGGGGAIITDNEMLARRAKHLTTTAKLPHAWEYRHDEIGYNFRMPNLNAALGCAQLEGLPAKLFAKRELFGRYKSAFSEMNGVRLFEEPPGCQSNYWLQTLVLEEEFMGQRDSILRSTNAAGYMTRPAWVLMNELEQFRKHPQMDLSTSISLSQRLINIPSSPELASVAR
jgi:aminotransferase in exopolysaccharide biosynthesis